MARIKYGDEWYDVEGSDGAVMDQIGKLLRDGETEWVAARTADGARRIVYLLLGMKVPMAIQGPVSGGWPTPPP